MSAVENYISKFKEFSKIDNDLTAFQEGLETLVVALKTSRDKVRLPATAPTAPGPRFGGGPAGTRPLPLISEWKSAEQINAMLERREVLLVELAEAWNAFDRDEKAGLMPPQIKKVY